MPTKIGSYTTKSGKTFPVLQIENEGSHYPFTIGKRKAQLIVENFEDIKKFAEGE